MTDGPCECYCEDYRVFPTCSGASNDLFEHCLKPTETYFFKQNEVLLLKIDILYFQISVLYLLAN